MTLAVAHRRVEDRMQVLLDAYLRSAVSGLSLGGVSDKLDAMRIVVGLDGQDLPPSLSADTLPRVEVFSVGSEADYEGALEYVDAFTTYTIAAVVQFDGADITAPARSASFLALYAAEVLEQYLPDPSGGSDTPCWRVDVSAPSSAEATIHDDSDRPHTMRATADILVSTRAAFGHSPTFGSPAPTPPAKPLVASADATVKVDATTLDTAPANRSTGVSISAAQLAAGTDIVIDMTAVAGWADGSAWSVFLTRHAATATGTLDDPDYEVIVALGTYDIEDGDRWVVLCEDATTNQVLTWALTWTVT